MKKGLIRDYIRDVTKALNALSEEPVAKIVAIMEDARRQGKRVFLLGNGGSAATASHIANDLAKTTIQPGMPRVKAIALTENVPIMTAWANDTSYDRIFAEQLENLCEPGDVVIAISGSGRSPNVLRGVQRARELGATTVGLTGFEGGELKGKVDVCLVVPNQVMGQIEDVHHAVGHILTLALSQPDSS